MKEGDFSVSVHLRDVPGVMVSIEKDAAWLDLTMFSGDVVGVASVTVHLASEPHQLRELATRLLEAAQTIERQAVRNAEAKLLEAA